MKAEELMRFDWVHLSDDDTPRQVDWIRSGEVGLFWNKTVTPPYLEPIPLTPEILKKNGFVQDGESFWYMDFRIVLCSSRGESLVCGRQIKFCYVHQLQHALKLCHLEKDIVI